MPALANFRRGVAAACLVALLSVPARAVTIDWATVGNPGNPADTTGYGSVAEEFRIGRHEVTIGQYTEFLNAVAGTDPYDLYKSDMFTNSTIAGIRQNTPLEGPFTYEVVGSANRPITYVDWFDAARFANWMHNGQGSGSTETGAYTLNGQTSGTAPARNPGAQYFIPTEDQWYKAAYYSPLLNSGSGGYFAYATQSNVAPGNVIGAGADQANYRLADGTYSVTQATTLDPGLNYLSAVGAFTASSSYYGTFDQTGNVFEWNDLSGGASASRGLRGGAWWSDALVLSSDRLEFAPEWLSDIDGFRLAAVPEPASLGIVAMGSLAVLGWTMLRQRPSR